MADRSTTPPPLTDSRSRVAGTAGGQPTPTPPSALTTPPVQPADSQPAGSKGSTASASLPAPSGTAQGDAAPASGADLNSVASNQPVGSTSSGGDASPRRTMVPLTSSPTATPRSASASLADGKGSQPAPQLTAQPGVSQPAPAIGAPVAPPGGSPQSPAATVQAAVDSHRVQPGDTLSSLAQTYYGDSKYADVLANANPNLANPNVLRLGTVLRIPPLPSDAERRVAEGSKIERVAAASGAARTYVVKSGDSFYSIAKSQLGNAGRWRELLSLNNAVVHGDPTSLQPGQKLVLPES